MAEVSFLHFPGDDHHFTVSEDIFTLENFPFWPSICASDSESESDSVPTSRQVHRHQHSSISANEGNLGFDRWQRIPVFVGSDSVTDRRENQVNFVMDLFHQRVDQSNLMGCDSFGSDLDDSSLPVVDKDDILGGNCVAVEVGLGLERRFELDEDDDDNCSGFVASDCGDEFFVARRESANGNPGNSSSLDGLRVVRIESDSEEDGDDGNECLLGIDEHSEEEEEDFGVNNVNYDDVNIPLCWDSLRLDDHGEGATEFDWEEVDGRAVDERELLSLVADSDEIEIEPIPVLPISGPGEDEDGDRGRGFGNLEWEVLLNVNHLERNPDMATDIGPYFGDIEDYVYPAEYEMMFGQFTEDDTTVSGRPPASKSVVEKLPTVVMTEEDMSNEKLLCAVCKDQIEVGEKAKGLPCSHRYHGECILPWLCIRNTCPVCRYELPTDDPEYEQSRTRRAVGTP